MSQLWVRRAGGTGEPCEGAFGDLNQGLEGRDIPGAKPRSGGLWTSTYQGELGSAWVQWCISEEFDVSRDDPTWSECWLLEPRDDAKIIEIDSHGDLLRLVRQYGHRLFHGDPARALDQLKARYANDEISQGEMEVGIEEVLNGVVRVSPTAELGSWRAFPDWSRLAMDYDGVHLTERGQWATRHTDVGLYGWDCESTLWLRWAFKEVRSLGRCIFREKDVAV